MPYYNTQAIVLASSNYSEADRILTLLTYERGRVRAIARGARRPRNRFTALAQPLNLIEVQLSGSSTLENLTQGQLVNNYRFLRQDLVRMAYAYYFLELFDKATEGASDLAEIFIMLLTALELIQYSNDLALGKVAIEMKLLAAIGFRPHLDSCIFCHQPLDNTKPLYYNIAGGGFTCPLCNREERDLLVTGGALTIMQELQRANLARLNELDPVLATMNNESSPLAEADRIVREQWRQILGDLPKATSFLDEVTQKL